MAHIVVDDGKANALSVGMFEELNEAFDRAEADRSGRLPDVRVSWNEPGRH